MSDTGKSEAGKIALLPIPAFQRNARGEVPAQQGMGVTQRNRVQAPTIVIPALSRDHCRRS